MTVEKIDGLIMQELKKKQVDYRKVLKLVDKKTDIILQSRKCKANVKFRS